MKCVLAVILSLLWTAGAVAQESVRVPYSSLYQALAPGLKIDRFERLVARQRIISRRSDVHPESIKVRILAKSGVIDIGVSAIGDIQFPMTDALLAENPMVESNQPKGSLSLSATMELKIPDALNVPYKEFFEAAKQAQQAIDGMGASLAGRKIHSIEFEFDRAESARIELVDERAEELLIANELGLLELRLDEDLVRRGAQVKFSHRARAVRPHID